MTGEEREKLFREWDEDYAARREENRREGVSEAGPPETWPSAIAQANRQKQPDGGNGHGHEDGHEAGHSL